MTRTRKMTMKTTKTTTHLRNQDQQELERQHDQCKDGIHKWEEEKAIVCNVCGMYQQEYEQRQLLQQQQELVHKKY